MKGHEFIVLAAILAAIGAAWALTWHYERARRRTLQSALLAAGLEPDPSPIVESKRLVWPSETPLAKFKTAEKGIKWLAKGRIGARTVAYFEHMYVTGSGKSRREHWHSVSVVTADSSDGAPPISLVPRTLMHRVAAIFGGKALKLEDEEFNARWHTECDDVDAAIVVLTPEVQRWCMSLPKDAKVFLGGGDVVVARAKKLKQHEALALVRLTCELADTLAAGTVAA